MQWRRFFTYTFAFAELDASWTARLIASKFIYPRFPELLARAEAREDPEEKALQQQTLLKNEDEARARVRLLREKNGNAIQVSIDVLENREYQLLGRHINACIYPIRDWYLNSVDIFSKGRLPCAIWMAKRACNWRDKCREILKVLSDDSQCLKCGVAPHHSANFPVPDIDPSLSAKESDELKSDEISQRAESLTGFALNLTAQLAWYMIQFEVCLPEGFAAAFHPNRDVAQNYFSKFQQTWSHMCYIGDNLQTLTHAGKLKACWKDAYWAHNNPLVHESVMICEDAAWNVSDPNVLEMALEQHGALPDTKRVLEDVFGHLKHLVSGKKNKRLDRHRVFCEASAARILQPGVHQSKKSEINQEKSHTVPTIVPVSLDAEQGAVCVAADDSVCVAADPPKHLRLPATDWETPLLVPIHKMGNGMFTTHPSHNVSGLNTKDMLKPLAKAAIPWRPAGPDAMTRMAAATAYISLEAWSSWKNIATCWCGCLLIKRRMYFDQANSRHFFSLGFTKYVAIVVTVKSACIDECNYFWLDPEQAQIETVANHSCTSSSAFRGVPVRALGSNCDIAGLSNVGMVWQQSNDIMNLVPFALLQGSWLAGTLLSALCSAFGLTTRVLPGYATKFTRLSYLTALVEHFFADEPFESQAEILANLVAARQGGAASHVLGDSKLAEAALDALDESTRQDFEDGFDKDEAGDDLDLEPTDNIDKQAPLGPPQLSPSGNKKNFTPLELKCLIPGAGELSGVYLVWRRSICQWESRYKDAMPYQSFSLTWGKRTGPNQSLTELECLQRVLNWMWAQHAKAKRCPTTANPKPSFENIKEAFEKWQVAFALRQEATANAPGPAAVAATQKRAKGKSKKTMKPTGPTKTKQTKAKKRDKETKHLETHKKRKRTSSKHPSLTANPEASPVVATEVDAHNSQADVHTSMQSKAAGSACASLLDGPCVQRPSPAAPQSANCHSSNEALNSTLFLSMKLLFCMRQLLTIVPIDNQIVELFQFKAGSCKLISMYLHANLQAPPRSRRRSISGLSP